MTAVAVSLPPINIPYVDKDTFKPTDQFYRWVETIHNRTGGDSGDRFEGTEEAVNELASGKADKTLTVTLGFGISGTSADLSANFTIGVLQDAGWTFATGTADKGAYATYTAPVISATYTQAEVQALADALQAATRRIKALEDALRLNEAITA